MIFSVIIPCYRYGHFLTQCALSALNQIGVEVRILIIDDASDDTTADIAKDLQLRDRRVQYVRHKSNIGHIATYNEGLAWADGDICLLLSADDYLLPGAFAHAAQMFKRHPQVGLIFGGCIADRGGCNVNRPVSAPAAGWTIMTGIEFARRSRGLNIVPTPTAMVRTALHRRVGLYRPELPHSGDMELWLRCAAQTRVACTDALLAVKRVHDANMTYKYTDTWRTDFLHRSAAVEWFETRCAEVGPQVADMAGRFRRDLALQAVAMSCGHCIRAQRMACDDAAALAIKTDPSVVSTPQWLLLTAIRLPRPKLWQRAGPVFNTLRFGRDMMRRHGRPRSSSRVV